MAEGTGDFESAVREPHSVTHRASQRRPDAYIFGANLRFLPIGVHMLATNAWLLARRTRPVERPELQVMTGSSRPLRVVGLSLSNPMFDIRLDLKVGSEGIAEAVGDIR